MPAHTPQLMPLVVLAFLAAGFVIAICALLAVCGFLANSRRMLREASVIGSMVLVGYGAVLLGCSLFSREVVLPVGGWKYICEIDCHIGYSVGTVQTATNAGPEMKQVSSGGQFVIVQVRAWFDPSTISQERGDGALKPNARIVLLRDARGGRYAPSSKSDAVLAALGLHSATLAEPLRPGDSRDSYMVFEVPAGAGGFNLWLGSGSEEEIVLWGAERSPWHKKIVFALPNAPGGSISRSS